MTDTQNVIAPETVVVDIIRDCCEWNSITKNVTYLSSEIAAKRILALAALHRLPTQSPLSQGGDAYTPRMSGLEADWEAEDARKEPAPGAEAVAELRCNAEAAKVYYKSRKKRPPYMMAVDAEKLLAALRSPATPAPAQGVTDEAVNRAMLAVQKGCDITPREMRKALQAAFHPAEKE